MKKTIQPTDGKFHYHKINSKAIYFLSLSTCDTSVKVKCADCVLHYICRGQSTSKLTNVKKKKKKAALKKGD